MSCPTTTAGTAPITDPLAEAILGDARVAAAVLQLDAVAASHAQDPERRAGLQRLLGAYAGTRAAAADLVNNLLLASTGMAAFHQLTPGTRSVRCSPPRSPSRRRSPASRSAPG